MAVDDTTKTILIVDDNPNFSYIWREFCEEEGHRVLVADDARQALRLVQTSARIDLVITDLVMPYISGYEFLQTLRGLPETRRTPVLMLSGSTKIVADLAEKEGARYLSKSLDTVSILRRIREALASPETAAPAPPAAVETPVEPDLPPFQIVHTSYEGFVPRQRVLTPWTGPSPSDKA